MNKAEAMPEQLTKHPDVTLQVLSSASDAQCGEGAPQQILKSCPAERFCALPEGELCIYGLDEAREMTQITPADLAAAFAQPPPAEPAPPSTPGFAAGAASGAVGGLVVGALLAVAVQRWRRSG